MPIVLRLDIDKPYGRTTLREKVISKLAEDYYFPVTPSLGYLHDLRHLLEYLNSKKIAAISYHRLCTAPTPDIVRLLKEGGHKFGLHAEDTRSLESLKAEVEAMRKLVNLEFHSFTKHGSGELQLGRRHYAPYEPEKYLLWSREIGVPYYFGNGVALSKEAFSNRDDFFPDMFWMDPGYQKPSLSTNDSALEIADGETLVLILHPENLRAVPIVRENFERFVSEAEKRRIPFITDIVRG